MKKIFILSGSIRKREQSHSFTFANYLSEAASTAGFEVALKHGGDLTMSPAEVSYHSNPFAEGVPEDIHEFTENVRDADIVMLVSPTYHGSYTSQMENLLDCLTEDAFRSKTIILASHGWGPSAIQPALHLQDVARTMVGNVYPRFITASKGDLSNGAPTRTQKHELPRYY